MTTSVSLSESDPHVSEPFNSGFKNLPFSVVRDLRLDTAELLTQESPGTFLSLALPARAGVERIPGTRFGWGTVGFVVEDQYMRDFFLKPSLRESFEAMVDAEIEKPGYWQRAHASFTKNEQVFMKVAETFFDRGLDGFSVEEVRETFIRLYKQIYALEQWALRQEEVILCTDELVTAAAKKDPALGEAMRELLLATEPNYLQQQDLALAEIGLRGASAADLEKHARNYFWIRGNYIRGGALTAQDFHSFLGEMGSSVADYAAHAQRIRDLLAKIRRDQEQFWPQVQAVVDARTLAALQIGARFAVWREQRKRVNLYWFSLLDRFVDWVVARHAVAEDVLRTLTPEEFVHAFGDPSIVAVADERLKGVAGVWHEGAEGIFTGENYHELTAAYEKAIAVEAAEELTGLPAAAGVAEGRVAVFLDPKKDACPEGCVLVTSMTRPEFVPFMKRAVAVVTDEGGMLSHAAIVSRELGIPCVVGTKHATRALMTGQRVHVDGTAGKIRVISS